MVSRQKLLEAAARIYAEGGFRGSTTRRIAEEAGVNEVTLFRLFGSKAHLIAEAVQCSDPMGTATLPDVPGDPQRELSEWCGAHLRAMRRARGFIRKTLADLEEHPEIKPHIAAEQQPHFRRLVSYAEKLKPPTSPRERTDLTTACTMLFASLFGDAMGRDIMESLYPQPERSAAKQYVRVFLHAIGVKAGQRPRGRARSRHGAHTNGA